MPSLVAMFKRVYGSVVIIKHCFSWKIKHLIDRLANTDYKLRSLLLFTFIDIFKIKYKIVDVLRLTSFKRPVCHVKRSKVAGMSSWSHLQNYKNSSIR